ncbi:hypothetical protein HPB50_013570 [Hyalomma asiaticum]|uniref:Uncharacterized protein n=1 Tax=Hyalomma asiaticum TaxID=266040 RepID=A0ACB7RUJ7_HYAAI|nr:hypothetical protein HPB50_013570 [Hyalomma asiaticum]
MGNEVDGLERELNLRRGFRNEIIELKESLELLSRQYEDMKSDCESVKAENVALKAAEEPLVDAILALKKQVPENDSKITAQDQYLNTLTKENIE